MRQPASQLLREHEDEIAAWLRERGLTGTETIPLLTRYVAAVNINFAFERIYRLIFGSQLRLLQHMNTQPAGQLPVSAAQVFYIAARAQHLQFYTTYPFDQWLQFLINSVLVKRIDSRIGITVRGGEFLTHLTKEGLTLNKEG